jgi:hypothetical protein
MPFLFINNNLFLAVTATGNRHDDKVEVVITEEEDHHSP